MKIYTDLVKKVIQEGFSRTNRTGIKTLTINGAMLQHDMKEGFPLLTTKKMAFNSIKVELEFFIKGLTSKKWLQERGCNIWDNWCNPKKIPDGYFLKKRKQFQKEEDDLGKIYGYQWRNFNGIDQLQNAIEKLKKDRYNRRIVVSAWNPSQLGEMALPPCHLMFHLNVLAGKLNLTWFQRSCDLALGIPFNIASYALLLHLIAKECRLKEGLVTGMLSDVHIYTNHLTKIKEQIKREPFLLPRIYTKTSKNIFKWNYKDTCLTNYNSWDKIKFDVAV